MGGRATDDSRSKVRRGRARFGYAIGSIILVGLLVLTLSTSVAVQDPRPAFFRSEVGRTQILDRTGNSLSIQRSNNRSALVLPLHRFPLLLQQAVIRAEDKRFYQHSGVDSIARAAALLSNLRTGRTVRGARTITEQVVRILTPRPSSLWTRWIEGFEAFLLERSVSKNQILEFYLNQVPFARQRRGFAEASALYYDRDVSTLSTQEILSLAVLVRSPGNLEKPSQSDRLFSSITTLAQQLQADGLLKANSLNELTIESLKLFTPTLNVEAPHFVGYVRSRLASTSQFPTVQSSLDPLLQSHVQQLLDARVQELKEYQVSHAAALVVNNNSAEILAWANAGTYDPATPQSMIDAVTTPRQPGSTLKPFLYGLALERGWTAATLIVDEPLQQTIRQGIHSYRNFSRTHYGTLRLREALGNSLNIPAIKAIRHVGAERFLRRLRKLGFTSLHRGIAEYGEGLALGNGEVSLFELVQAYASLARGGEFRSLQLFPQLPEATNSERIFSSEISSLIANILADRQARQREFGSNGVLHLPYPTAVKTGTSNDFRDSWALGFSSEFTVGVWMGNLSREATKEISGVRGPALILRGIFQKLNEKTPPKDLQLSQALTQQSICSVTGLRATPSCPHTTEWFIGNSAPEEECHQHALSPSNPSTKATAYRGDLAILFPTPQVLMAKDPRIPDELEKAAFKISPHPGIRQAEWFVDGISVAVTGRGVSSWNWPVERGEHRLAVTVSLEDKVIDLPAVAFSVR